jgi:hypothetical protein
VSLSIKRHWQPSVEETLACRLVWLTGPPPAIGLFLV